MNNIDWSKLITAEDKARASVPSTVSRRQFKMQLAISGLSAQVETWIASQPELVQIAFEESGSFVRTDEMLVLGFDALGFTEEQVDQFFTEAARL
ncbi:hypothetical protein [Phyllobacterium zundukense]|uniref:Uncharacterized protein n=1 Tax=Phyllobacterium zundukense TaxID=1867719 RepID=A0ACD4D790_9HYPH|nr:hypothetical protein [Phyllobacterium zundukense]UXN61563.1 hypothetical protein N8E88_16010 [Phyllobacterium zundukense]